MIIRTKKKIAKEILFLFTVIIFGIISYIGVYFYNLFLENKISNLSNTIKVKTTISDSLGKPYLDFQERIKNEELKFDEYGIPIRSKFKRLYYLQDGDRKKLDSLINQMHIEKVSSESIKIFEKDFKNLHSVEFYPENKSLPPFVKQKFIEYNGQELFAMSNSFAVSSKDSSNYTKSTLLNKELQNERYQIQEYKKSLISSKEQRSFVLKVSLISFLFLFILRYIYYLVRWSLNTLKQKD